MRNAVDTTTMIGISAVTGRLHLKSKLRSSPSPAPTIAADRGAGSAELRSIVKVPVPAEPRSMPW